LVVQSVAQAQAMPGARFSAFIGRHISEGPSPPSTAPPVPPLGPSRRSEFTPPVPPVPVPTRWLTGLVLQPTVNTSAATDATRNNAEK
jgi:hypothetical protein